MNNQAPTSLQDILPTQAPTPASSPPSLRLGPTANQGASLAKQSQSHNLQIVEDDGQELHRSASKEKDRAQSKSSKRSRQGAVKNSKSQQSFGGFSRDNVRA